MTDVSRYDLAQMDAPARARLMRRAEDDLSPYIEQVAPVIDAVKQRGDAALRHFAKEFDGAEIGDVRVSDAEMDAAFDAIAPEMLETLRYAIDNVRRFHEAQKPPAMEMMEIRPGALVGERWTPVSAAALYSPRGKGSFPVVTLMTALPAVIAGVETPVILTPPGPDGAVDPATLVVARLTGVETVCKAGGALAVAAAAFGTESVPRCDVIEGPGSPWFVAARRLLAPLIHSRLPAGPTEALILADETADPALCALDLAIESEHGPDSSSYLVTWSAAVADAAAAALPGVWSQMGDERAGYSQTVLGGEMGGIVLAPSADAAYAFVNAYAPEHLQVMSERPFDHLPHIRNAAEILLGQDAPGSVANYLMGPNCVLPTAAAAKVHGPLSVRDFMKSSSVGHLTRDAYLEMAPHTERFARYEGFDAHALAVSELRETLRRRD